MKYAKRLVSAALTAALVLAFGGLAQAEDTIKIAIAAPLTGTAAGYGDNVKAGAMMKIDEINAKGGINGKKIEAVAFDEQCVPREAATVSTKIAMDKDIVGVIGHVCSSAHLAALPIYLREGVPLISPTATGVTITGKNVDAKGKVWGFRNVFRDDAQGAFMASYAAKVLGLKKVAVFYEQNDYGIGLKDAFIKQAKADGMQVVGEEGYVKDVQDFTPQITKIKAQSPDGVFIAGYYAEGALIASQAKKLGLNVVKMGGDGLDNEDYIKLAGNASDDSYLPTPFLESAAGPEAKAFFANFKAKTGRDPDYMSANAYDAAGVLLAAIAKVGPDRAKVREAIAAFNSPQTAYKGVTGLNSFDAMGDSKKPLFVKMVKGGKFVPAPKQMQQ
ncbi:branched-chain amino acid ABC transporter substrate-binding protein [Fundidesulfovibrio butyratiphilus]